MRHSLEWVGNIRSVLADVSGWFNWDALSAIGTVGALWFVILEVTRAGRAERAKSIGILTFLIGLIEPVEFVPIYEDDDGSALERAPRDQVETALSIVRDARSGVASLPLSDASAAGVVEWTMALPLALKDIEEVLVNRSTDDWLSALSSTRYVAEAVEHFREQRDRLRHGAVIRPLIRFLRWSRTTWSDWQAKRRLALADRDPSVERLFQSIGDKDRHEAHSGNLTD